MTTIESLRSTLTELRRGLRRVAQRTLEEDDWSLVYAFYSSAIARSERRMERMLAKVEAEQEEEAAGDAESTLVDAEAREDAEAEGEGPRRDVEDTSAVRGHSSTGSSDRPESKPKRKGHGRNGAGAYVNATDCFHTLMEGILGGLCEACGVGSMSRYRDKLLVVIKGQPLFGAEIHHFEQARCRLCGTVLSAEDPQAVHGGLGSSYITYDASACAMLLVMHYFAGLPFKRLESLQAGWGIPLPDANQWALADACADRLFPLYKALERHGIQNALALRIDDTGSMVIEVRREIRAEIGALEALGQSTKDVRTGINATGVYLETEQGRVLLFFTGRHHAGEIVDRILKHRQAAQPKLVKVSDAASKNFSHAHHDDLEEAVCNAHAYLKFRAVKDQHPEEYGLAGEVYKKVFDNDDVAAKEGMDPHERMLHHRKHSLPQMKRLKKMCREKLQSRLVEPNSPLWEPLTFVIHQWSRLTRFCEVPGVPLDTNVVEQMLIIPVRYLAGSFNYQTQNGADVGDRHMSLIATANANGVEPVAYLTECLENYEDLKARPEHYLPWVYRARLEAGDEESRATQEPCSGQAVEHPLRTGTHRRPSRAPPPREPRPKFDQDRPAPVHP